MENICISISVSKNKTTTKKKTLKSHKYVDMCTSPDKPVVQYYDICISLVEY